MRIRFYHLTAIISALCFFALTSCTKNETIRDENPVVDNPNMKATAISYGMSKIGTIMHHVGVYFKDDQSEKQYRCNIDKTDEEYANAVVTFKETDIITSESVMAAPPDMPEFIRVQKTIPNEIIFTFKTGADTYYTKGLKALLVKTDLGTTFGLQGITAINEVQSYMNNPTKFRQDVKNLASQLNDLDPSQPGNQPMFVKVHVYE